MSREVLHPGAVLGSHPERRHERRKGLEEATHRIFGRLAARRRLAPRRIRERIAAVGRAARGLDDLDDARLASAAADLRAAFARSGLVEPLVARAFALVREAASRTLGLRHHDSQLFGGWVMIEGGLAEMETGEGKTLTATLPASAAALAGIPVHVISVNDYLVARDAKEMEPVYQALGLRVGAVTADLEDPDARRAAYACDVTYCSNKQLTFDYLRDRLVRGSLRGGLPLRLERLHKQEARIDRLLLRGLCFALVDEADSVLVDEARTPLVLSRTRESAEEEQVFCEALAFAESLTPDLHCRIDPRERETRLTELGRQEAERRLGPRGGVWAGRRHREELVRQALSALHLFHRDHHYLVRDDKVQIIDPHTGRVMADRSWERGLHQMIEVKEGCSVTGQRETLARISYQQFFRRYLRLSGMTGTAQEVAGELWSVYRLPVVRVPTFRPLRRRELGERCFVRSEDRWRAVVQRVQEMHATGRPILVGTCSVASSERLSRLLHAHGLGHQLLNARQDREEAEIVARAGERGRITVATNMAGRGTDIRLGPGVRELGGLHVLSTERSEARRIDRQLRGRCGRQGDPGTTESVVSLEDPLPGDFYPIWLMGLLGALPGLRGNVPRRLGLILNWIPQIAVERQHARLRRELLRLDERLGSSLAFSGAPE